MSATFLKSITDLAHLPPGKKPHVALVGRSNVGKSSLVNRLTGERGLARVSSAAGHTQTINFYETDGRYFLVDLPGYGFARRSKQKQTEFAALINDYLSHAKQLTLVLHVIDARLGLTESDQRMQTNLTALQIPNVIILNKMDKLTRAEANSLVRSVTAAYPTSKLLTHSLTTSKDLGELFETIERAVRTA